MRLVGLQSTGEAAQSLGITRDQLLWALRTGAPKPTVRAGGRRVFTEEDVRRLRQWFAARTQVRIGLQRGDMK